MKKTKYDGYYATEDGKIFSTYSNKFLKATNDKRGYCVVDIHRKKVKIHRLIAETFLPNPQNLPQINHINGDRKDNRLSNLEFCDGSYNHKHSYETTNRSNKKIPVLAYCNGRLVGKYESIGEASRSLSVCPRRISECVNGHVDKHKNYTFKAA